MDASGRPSPLTGRIRFDRFTLDTGRAELARDGVVVPMRPKTRLMLAYLCAHPGRVLGKAELIDAVWPGVVVTDDSLSQCIGELRAALDDSAQKLIRTVPRSGYRFDAEVRPLNPSPAAEATPTPAPAVPVAGARLWIALLLSAMAIAGTMLLIRTGGSPTPNLDERLAERRSIGVLPFVNLGPADADYFAAGVTDDVIHDLVRMRDIQVVTGTLPRDRGDAADVQALGREMRVRFVLTGTVRRDGDSVHIGARLTDTERGHAVWSERFDYASGRDWNWQRDLTHSLARQLVVRVLEREALRRDPAVPDAVDQVMRGQQAIRHVAGIDDVNRARQHFLRALAADPSSVAALNGMAWTHTRAVFEKQSADAQADARLAMDYLTRSLALSPDHPQTLTILGNALLIRGELDAACRSFERAVEQDPNFYGAWQMIAVVKVSLGRAAEAAAPLAHVRTLDPLNPMRVGMADYIESLAALQLGGDEDAARLLRSAVAHDPKLLRGWLRLAALDALAGRHADAAAHLARARALQPNVSLASLRTSGYRENAAAAQQSARIREGLRIAGLQ